MRNVFRPAVMLATCWFVAACSTEASLESLRLDPATPQLVEGERIAVRVVGVYDDGTEGDVSSEATISLSGTFAAWKDGRLEGLRFGEDVLEAKVGELVVHAPVRVSTGELELRTEGNLEPGGQAQLVVTSKGHEGRERQVEAAEVGFSSSNDAIATIGEDGTIHAHAGGAVTFTVTAGDLEASLEARVQCPAPAPSRMLWVGQTMPTLSWPARAPDGSLTEVDLAAMRCDLEWEDTRTVALVLIAGWCGPCTSYVQSLQGETQALRDLGMEVVIVMIEDRDRNRATLDEAFAHVETNTSTIPGFVVSDAENEYTPMYLRGSGIISAFPTIAVLRLKDMRLIAHSKQTNFRLPLAEIALIEDGIWEP